MNELAETVDSTPNTKELIAYSRKAFPEHLNPRQRAWLTSFAMCGKISETSRISGISWSIHYFWLEKSEAYKTAFARAEKIYSDVMIAECRRRAVEGDDKPVFGKNGELLASVKQKSDNLLMFSIKAKCPEYRDNFTINQFIGPTQFSVSGPKPVSQQTPLIDVTKDKD